jgi:hypothetical protein
MTYKEYLFSGISSCWGPCPKYTISTYDLLMFTLGSFVVISILNFYYSRIPKSNNSISEFDTPIYQTQDILLQSNSNNANLISTQDTTSTWAKIVVFVLITFVVIIPVDQLFSFANSF